MFEKVIRKEKLKQKKNFKKSKAYSTKVDGKSNNKLDVQNKNNVQTNKTKINKIISAERAVLTSVVVDIFDILFNVTIAIFSGSVVMLAEALQGVADFISAIFVFVGLKSSKKPADANHPFGYGKSLYMWTFVSGLIMFSVTSAAVIYFGVQQVRNPEHLENLIFAYLALSFFIVSNGYSLSLSIRRILNGKKLTEFFIAYKNSNMIETKTTLTLDLIGTSSAVFGLTALILYGVTGNPKFDGYGAIMIGLSLAFLTIFLLRSSRSLIVGRRASARIENMIEEVVLSVKHVKSIPDLKTINIGLGSVLVILDVHVTGKLTTKRIEVLIDEIKRKVKKNVREVKYIQVEIETPEKPPKNKRKRQKK